MWSVQKFFNFSFKKKRESKYLLLDSNQKAFMYLSNWPNWFGSACVIFGKKGYGKSSLLDFWQGYSKAIKIDLFEINQQKLSQILSNPKNIILDDFDKYFNRKDLLINLDCNDISSYEEVLINIFDVVKKNGKSLLLSSTLAVDKLSIKTEDFLSRVKAANHFVLDEPKDNDKRLVLLQLLSEFQLSLKEEVIEFITCKTKKSYHQISKIVNILNDFSFESRRDVKISDIKKLL
jgi:chromosomal replication initiation ATPase DnaA